MTDLNTLITDLRAKAEAATPGPWEPGDGKNNGGFLSVYCDDATGQRVAQTDGDFLLFSHEQKRANAAFIAAANPAANPAAILTILAALAEARGQIEELTHKQCVVPGALRYDGFGDWWCNLKHPSAETPKDFGVPVETEAQLAALRTKRHATCDQKLASLAKTLTERDAELATLRAEVARLEAENFTLAAGVCVVDGGLIGDEGGTPYCTLRAEVEQYKTILANPIAVYHNMLRGTIATPEHFARYETQLSELRAEVERLRSLGWQMDQRGISGRITPPETTP